MANNNCKLVTYKEHMSFEKIWGTNRTRLLSFIKSKVDDTAQAEDLLQEVGVKLHKAMVHGTEVNNYSLWLFQVARNTISDFYRRKNITLKDIAIPSEDSASCVCDLSGFVIKNYLPEKYGTPLYLSDIEQVPQKEIAEMMNLTLTATKSRIQRARVLLKELVLTCVDIQWNNKGQATDFQLKQNCKLPIELQEEMDRINLSV